MRKIRCVRRVGTRKIHMRKIRCVHGKLHENSQVKLNGMLSAKEWKLNGMLSAKDWHQIWAKLHENEPDELNGMLSAE